MRCSANRFYRTRTIDVVRLEPSKSSRHRYTPEASWPADQVTRSAAIPQTYFPEALVTRPWDLPVLVAAGVLLSLYPRLKERSSGFLFRPRRGGSGVLSVWSRC